MHELSVCQALLDQAAQVARQHRADEVACITVRVGPLSGVDPAQLRRAFEAMRLGPSAAADLVIETAEVVVSCLVCASESTARVNRLVCAACGGFRIRVIAGDELQLRRVELRVCKSRGQ